MRHAVLEGQIEGNRFSIKAGAVRASGIRERERRGTERAEEDSTRSTLAEGRSHRTISEAGNVRGRKTRVEGGRERGAERVRERSIEIREEEIQGGRGR